MALANLIARLEEEARTRAAAIERAADDDVRRIETATEREVAELTARHLAREHAGRHAVQACELAAARQRAHARTLAATRAQIARILERARSIVDDAAPSPEHTEALPAHLDEALSYLEGLHPRIRCRAAFAPLLRNALARHEGATLIVDESVGAGLVAEAGDGSVVVDNTLAVRLAHLEPRLTIELSRKLADACD